MDWTSLAIARPGKSHDTPKEYCDYIEKHIRAPACKVAREANMQDDAAPSGKKDILSGLHGGMVMEGGNGAQAASRE